MFESKKFKIHYRDVLKENIRHFKIIFSSNIYVQCLIGN